MNDVGKTTAFDDKWDNEALELTEPFERIKGERVFYLYMFELAEFGFPAQEARDPAIDVEAPRRRLRIRRKQPPPAGYQDNIGAEAEEAEQEEALNLLAMLKNSNLA